MNFRSSFLLLASALLLMLNPAPARAQASTLPCGASVHAFKNAYMKERMPEVAGLMAAMGMVKRAIEELRQDEVYQARWQAASAEKRAAFLRELHKETTPLRLGAEKLVRQKLAELSGPSTTPVAQCVPAALLDKYPQLLAHLQHERSLMPLALTLAVDGIPARVADDTPEKEAARKDAAARMSGTLPAYPFAFEPLEPLTLAAVAGLATAPRVVTDEAALREWASGWGNKLNLKSPLTFHGTQDDTDLLTAMLQELRPLMSSSMPLRERDRMAVYTSQALQNLFIELKRK